MPQWKSRTPLTQPSSNPSTTDLVGAVSNGDSLHSISKHITQSSRFLNPTQLESTRAGFQWINSPGHDRQQPSLLLGVVGGAGVAHFFGPRYETPAKEMPYECGIPPTGSSRNPFSVKFYLVALFFILFDIEVVFLFPWALVYRDLVGEVGVVILVDMAIFLGILLVCLAYMWKKGALEWE